MQTSLFEMPPPLIFKLMPTCLFIHIQVCCNPSERHLHETKCSLNFGSRAMKIRNTAYVNVEVGKNAVRLSSLSILRVNNDVIISLRERH